MEKLFKMFAFEIHIHIAVSIRTSFFSSLMKETTLLWGYEGKEDEEEKLNSNVKKAWPSSSWTLSSTPEIWRRRFDRFRKLSGTRDQ